MCFIAITISQDSHDLDIRRAALVFQRNSAAVADDVRAGRPVVLLHDQDADGTVVEQLERRLQRLDSFGLNVALHISQREPSEQDLRSGCCQVSPQNALHLLRQSGTTSL